MFDKVLVANRGEIAVRIFRTLRELGIGAVAVYSEADRDALHVAYADEAFLIGPAPAAESYLAGRAARRRPRSAPGRRRSIPATAFSPRTRRFARAVEEAGLVWIGPPPAAIELMGIKTAARTAMQAAGVPIIPGTTDPVGSVEELLGARRGDRLSAADQGGGRRRRQGDGGRATAPEQAERAFETARRQGQSYFAEPGRVRREADRRSAPRRGAGARRRARQRHPPRRARLHDPAPPPEARRGDAVAGRRRRSCARGSARSASRRRARAATARPGRSRACSRATATTSSWR